MSQSSFKHPNTKYALSEKLALFGYSLAVIFAVIPLFLFWVLQYLRRKPAFNFHRLSRFSIYSPRGVNSSDVLIHCVSVGEVNVAATLIRHLRKSVPDLAITVTTTTPTGAENVRSSMPNDIQHVYLPLDIGWFMSRLIKRVKPKKVLVVEVELWPNMIRQCNKLGVPVCLVNGRMTDKSARNYLKLKYLFNPMLRSLQLVCAQGERDFKNYLRLGMTKERLLLTGNIKFDLDMRVSDASKALIELLPADGKQIIIAGSTHDPEEEIVLAAAEKLKNSYSDLLWFIVPRHPQRFEHVVSLASHSVLKTHQTSLTSQKMPDIDVFIVDQMGVLSGLYSIADIAFVGGSIAQRGGHNALEPVSVGTPAIMGPHRYNNPSICEVLEQCGSLKLASTSDELVSQVSAWLDSSEERKKAGEAGAAVVKQHKGATIKTLQALALQNAL